jgi:uncharacterized protein YjbJ (UPF0337 family)
MSINKHQVRGRTSVLKGKLNEVAGKILGDRRLQLKGRLHTGIGKARAALGDLMHDMNSSSKKDT